jgi:hypothetical protein
MLPEEIAIVHVLGQQWHGFPEALENSLADKAVKEAAFYPELHMLHLTPIIQAPSMNPIFNP